MFEHVKLLKEVPKLSQINEEGTRFYLTPEGNKYPSVTTVLSEYNRKELFEWRRRVGEETANKISKQASTRGTAIHKYCEEYLNNCQPVINTPDKLEMFNSLKPYLNRINKIHAQELRMYSNHLRMAGTVDCIAELDGKLMVIDFKTSSRPKDKSKIENYFMQCSAYAIMFEEIFKIPIDKIAVIIAVDSCEPQLFMEKRDNYVEKLIFYRDRYESKNNH